MSTNGHAPLDYSQAHAEIDAINARVRDVERKHRQAGEDSAAAESWYRQSLAKSYASHREQGKAQDESSVLARGDVAPDSWERDRARNRVSDLSEQLENLRAERASLHELVRWSRAKDGAA